MRKTLEYQKLNGLFVFCKKCRSDVNGKSKTQKVVIIHWKVKRIKRLSGFQILVMIVKRRFLLPEILKMQFWSLLISKNKLRIRSSIQ